MEGFWRIGRERLQMVSDLLEVEQLETVVKGLQLIRSAEEEIQKNLDSAQSTE